MESTLARTGHRILTARSDSTSQSNNLSAWRVYFLLEDGKVDDPLIPFSSSVSGDLQFRDIEYTNFLWLIFLRADRKHIDRAAMFAS